LLLISATVCLLTQSPFCSLLTWTSDPREYCISTKDFVVDENNNLTGLNTGMNSENSSYIGYCQLFYFFSVRVEWTKDSAGRWKMEEVPGSDKFFPAQLVFLALGFLGPEAKAVKQLGLKQDARSNIQTPPKVRLYA
jgi:glutamate synthase (NADPH/NADH)